MRPSICQSHWGGGLGCTYVAMIFVMLQTREINALKLELSKKENGGIGSRPGKARQYNTINPTLFAPLSVRFVCNSGTARVPKERKEERGEGRENIDMCMNVCN